MIVIAGAIIGILLGALGGGGSILAVPALVQLAGYSVSTATTVSLVAVGVSSLVSMSSHLRRGNVRVGVGVSFVAAGVVASALGNWAGKAIDDDVLMLLFSGLIFIAAHRMLTACPSCTRIGEANAPEGGGAAKLNVGWIILAGSAVGFLTGMFGVGGGFVVVPALTLALGFSMPVAIGTSLFIVAGNAAVSLGIRGLGSIDWDVALPFVIVMLIGSLVGARIAPKLPPIASLRVFAGVLVAVAITNGALSIAALV